MTLATGALGVMLGGFAAGGLAILIRSARAARLVTALGAMTGCVGGLVAAASVAWKAEPTAVAYTALVAPAGGLLLHVDLLGALFLALVSAVGFLATLYGVSYTAAYDGHRSLGVFGFLFCGFLLGMSLVVSAGNVFTFLLAWELMGVTSYLLVMTESDRPDTREAGLWYVAMMHFGLVLLLPMFLLMAPGVEATTFADLRTTAPLLSGAARNLVFLLALAGFGSKAGLVPLHVRLPRAHPAAPSHVSALMSGVMPETHRCSSCPFSRRQRGALEPWLIEELGPDYTWMLWTPCSPGTISMIAEVRSGARALRRRIIASFDMSWAGSPLVRPARRRVSCAGHGWSPAARLS